MLALFAGVGASATGLIALVSVSPLAAEDMLGSPAWSGLPSGLSIVGTAFGTSWLSSVMLRKGRRFGLLLGYAVAAVASLAAAAATSFASFLLFSLGAVGAGIGFGANRLSRYAAADLYPESRHAAAIGWVVWAGTVGSVLGPSLLAPSRRMGLSLGLSATIGPFLMTALAFALAWLVLYRGFSVPPASVPVSPSPSRESASVATHLAEAKPRFALVAMMVGQIVMVLVMTMTPVHIRNGGKGLGAIGLVFAAHTLGMYALSPLAGYLSDRWGRIPLIASGLLVLAASGILAASAGTSQPLLVAALFLLGLGWNFGFVAGSALLTDSVPDALRLRAQGLGDSIVWGSSALASLGSGFLMAALGFAALSTVGAVLALVPAALLLVDRRSLTQAI